MDIADSLAALRKDCLGTVHREIAISNKCLPVGCDLCRAHFGIGTRPGCNLSCMLGDAAGCTAIIQRGPDQRAERIVASTCDWAVHAGECASLRI